jgi:hypothetical protein
VEQRISSKIEQAQQIKQKQEAAEQLRIHLRTFMDGLRAATTGHLFNAASSTRAVTLPLCLLHSVLDFLPTDSLALGLAATSRVGYASVQEYALAIRTKSMAAAVPAAAAAAAAAAAPIAAGKSNGRGREAEAGAPSSSPSSPSSARGSEVAARAPLQLCSLLSDHLLSSLLASHLCFLVSGLGPQSESDSGRLQLNSERLAEMAGRMPQLVQLHCCLENEQPVAPLHFPSPAVPPHPDLWSQRLQESVESNAMQPTQHARH